MVTEEELLNKLSQVSNKSVYVIDWMLQALVNPLIMSRSKISLKKKNCVEVQRANLIAAFMILKVTAQEVNQTYQILDETSIWDYGFFQLRYLILQKDC